MPQKAVRGDTAYALTVFALQASLDRNAHSVSGV